MPKNTKPPVNDTLEAFLKLIQNLPSRAEFVESFGNVVKRIKAFEEKLAQDFSNVRDTILAFQKQIEAKIEVTIAGVDSKVDARLAEIPSVDALKGADGKDGQNGKDGKDGKDGMDGEDADPADEQAIIDKIEKDLPALGMAIRDGLELLTGDERLKVAAISGLEEEIKRIAETLPSKAGSTGWGAHPLAVQQSGATKVKLARVINFTGATVTHSPQGVTTVAITGGGGTGFVGSQEKSTTTPNGSQQTFAFTHTPLIIYWNGQMQTLTDDYTVSSNNITFTGTLIPQTGDKIVNVYA